jgi:hypothetical protein
VTDWFCQIVICSRVQHSDLVFLEISSRNNNYSDGGRNRAELSAHVSYRRTGRFRVEKNQIGRHSEDSLERLPEASGCVNDIPVQEQSAAEFSVPLSIVIND